MRSSEPAGVGWKYFYKINKTDQQLDQVNDNPTINICFWYQPGFINMSIVSDGKKLRSGKYSMAGNTVLSLEMIFRENCLDKTTLCLYSSRNYSGCTQTIFLPSSIFEKSSNGFLGILTIIRSQSFQMREGSGCRSRFCLFFNRFRHFHLNRKLEK